MCVVKILCYWAAPHGGVELTSIDIGRNMPNIIVRIIYTVYTIYTIKYHDILLCVYSA